MDLVFAIGISSSGVVAAFAPVPWLRPAVEILTNIIKLYENVKTNREAARQLCKRCIMLLEALRDHYDTTPRMTEVLDTTKETLRLVQAEMEDLAKLTRLKSFLKQFTITKDCQRCNQAISDCLTKFTLVSHLEIHKWLGTYGKCRERDRLEVESELQDVTNAKSTIQDALACSEPELTQCVEGLPGLFTNIQDNLREIDDETRDGFRKVLGKCHELLPDLKLHRGEIQLTREPRLGGMEVCEGTYLGSEKVLVKMVSRENLSDKIERRFLREADIWRRVYKTDKGQHLVPFYGFSEIGGSMYMITPWQENGTVIDYVIKQDQTMDHRQLIRGIAEGIRVLHTMDPPIVHGSIQGVNIFMNTDLNPLLANFGVSRLVEDISSAPYTESNVLPDSSRWRDPEVNDSNRLSLSSDVYSFAMTIFELMTHKKPFSEYRNPMQVALKAAQGHRPPRPSEPLVIDRGLDDDLWTLISSGWAKEASERPSIQEMLTVL